MSLVKKYESVKKNRKKKTKKRAHLALPGFCPFCPFCLFANFPPRPPFGSCSTVTDDFFFLFGFSVSAAEWVLFLALGADGWAGWAASREVEVAVRVWGGIWRFCGS
jgi:hypothetical protein